MMDLHTLEILQPMKTVIPKLFWPLQWHVSGTDRCS